jgi:hypothetical protein
MKYPDNESEYERQREWLNTEIDLEDEIAKASEQLEMQALMEEAYNRGRGYGKAYSDGFVAGVRFYHEKDEARQKARRIKFEEFNKRWGILP